MFAGFPWGEAGEDVRYELQLINYRTPAASPSSPSG